LSEVRAVVEEVNKQLIAKTPELREDPVIVGPVTVGSQLVFRVTITVANGSQSRLSSQFLAAYLQALHAKNIPLSWEGTNHHEH
jgi:small conductance mechanosensitive channel